MADRMIRKQLYIDSAQERALKRLARELGSTEAEIVRRAIDEFVERRASPVQRARDRLRHAGLLAEEAAEWDAPTEDEGEAATQRLKAFFGEHQRGLVDALLDEREKSDRRLL